MSHLANELKSIAERHHMIPMDISRATGLPPSHLSRLLNNHTVAVSDEVLEKLKVAVCRTPEERAMMVRARMLDVCSGVGADMIDVQINLNGRSRPADNAMILPVRLDPKVRDAIAWMAKRTIEAPGVGAGLISLAKMLGYTASE